MKWSRDVLPCVAPSLLICGALLLTGSAWCADAQGIGLISMNGAILETPCDIAVGDRDQSLIMDTVPLSQIVREGRGPEQDFAIRLVECVLIPKDAAQPNWQRFAVTFDGDSDGGYFGVTGRARGVALMIRDAQGVLATPGNPLPESAITSDEMQLNYTVALVANQEALRAGDYRSAVRFKLEYY